MDGNSWGSAAEAMYGRWEILGEALGMSRAGSLPPFLWLSCTLRLGAKSSISGLMIKKRRTIYNVEFDWRNGFYVAQGMR